MADYNADALIRRAYVLNKIWSNMVEEITRKRRWRPRDCIQTQSFTSDIFFKRRRRSPISVPTRFDGPGRSCSVITGRWGRGYGDCYCTTDNSRWRRAKRAARVYVHTRTVSLQRFRRLQGTHYVFAYTIKIIFLNHFFFF